MNECVYVAIIKKCFYYRNLKPGTMGLNFQVSKVRTNVLKDRYLKHFKVQIMIIKFNTVLV